MKVNVHAVNFNIDKKLVDFIDERMSKLEKYYDKVISSDAFLKVENISEKENKIVELKVQRSIGCKGKSRIKEKEILAIFQ